MRRPGFAVLAVCSLFAACGNTDDARRNGLTATSALTPSDSVVLVETDSGYVGSPTHLTVGQDGTLFISDALNSAVMVFTRDGRFVRQIGRAGSGPGEMGTPVASALDGDSLLAVADWRESRTSVFNHRSGEFIRATRHEGLPFSMHFSGDTLWYGNINPTRATSLAKWSGDGDVDYLGPLPAQYVASRQLMLSHPYVSTASDGANLILGFTAHPSIFVTSRDGRVLDTLTVPAVRRRGVPNDIVQRFTRPLEDSEIASMVSALVAVYPRPDGGVAVVYYDVDFKDGLITADGFLSLVSPDRKRACADVQIPFGRDGRPAVAFAADTLFTLETRLRDNARAENVVKTYPLADVQCGWNQAML